MFGRLLFKLILCKTRDTKKALSEKKRQMYMKAADTAFSAFLHPKRFDLGLKRFGDSSVVSFSNLSRSDVL